MQITFSILEKFDLDYHKGELNFHSYSTYILQPLEGLQKEIVEKLVMEFINNSIKSLTDELTEKLISFFKRMQMRSLLLQVRMIF